MLPHKVKLVKQEMRTTIYLLMSLLPFTDEAQADVWQNFQIPFWAPAGGVGC